MKTKPKINKVSFPNLKFLGNQHIYQEVTALYNV